MCDPIPPQTSVASGDPPDASGTTPIAAPTRTPAEQSLIDEMQAKKEAGKLLVRWKFKKIDDKLTFFPDHPDVELGVALTMQALGLTHRATLTNVMGNLAESACVNGELNEERLTRLLTQVRSFEPRDEVEAMMAVQMVLANNASSAMAALQRNAQSAQQRDSASRAFNRAARTFAIQLEALKKYRSNGQKIVIEHMNVNEGGQAIVGGVGRDVAGQAVVHGNDQVEVVPARAPKPRRPRKAAPPPALTAATEDERVTLPFEAVVHPDIELVARRAETRAQPAQPDQQRSQPRPPKVNTSSRVWLQHWRRRLRARSNRHA